VIISVFRSIKDKKMDNTVIQTEKITKRFKTVTALDDISIQVKKGKYTAFSALMGLGKQP
jgi:ABC-type multidrug transport system ATPase subunit